MSPDYNWFDLPKEIHDRHEAHVSRVEECLRNRKPTDSFRSLAQEIVQDDMAWRFQEEPEVAEAMRFGLARTEVWTGSEPFTRTVSIGPTDYQLYRLAYPEPEDPRYGE